jgi:uncharacterized small protein (DUF1192 family)
MNKYVEILNFIAHFALAAAAVINAYSHKNTADMVVRQTETLCEHIKSDANRWMKQDGLNRTVSAEADLHADSLMELKEEVEELRAEVERLKKEQNRGKENEHN